jgi:hypothetical protein
MQQGSRDDAHGVTIDNPTRAFENAPQHARNVFID